MSSANARTFRSLLKTTKYVADHTDIGNPEGFVKYVSNRFRVVAEANRRARIRPNDAKKHRVMVSHYTAALREAIGDAELASILGALGAGVGSSVYKRTLEKGFFDLVLFRKRSEDRGEADEEQTSERQNRIMQAAIAPIAEKLAHLHKGLSVPELRNAMSSTKVGTAVLAISHGGSEIAVEIDEELNKQTIFVRVEEDDFESVMLQQGQKRAQRLQRLAQTEEKDEVENETSEPSTANLKGGNAEEQFAHEFSLLNDRVEVCESEIIRGTTLHAHWNSLATRLFDAAMQELPLHRSRSTVIAGHGVGGAVGLVIALQLHTMGFEVKNVLQFGSPRIIQDTLNRYVSAVNPLRVVISGDPVTEGPLTTSEGESFVHVGEVLTLDVPAAQGDDVDDDSAQSEKAFVKKYHINRYVELLHRSDVGLSYAEGDESYSEPEWKQASPSADVDMAQSSAATKMHGGPALTYNR